MKGSKLQINGSLKAAEQLQLPLAVTQIRRLLAPSRIPEVASAHRNGPFLPSFSKSLVVLDLPLRWLPG